MSQGKERTKEEALSTPKTEIREKIAKELKREQPRKEEEILKAVVSWKSSKEQSYYAGAADRANVRSYYAGAADRANLRIDYQIQQHK